MRIIRLAVYGFRYNSMGAFGNCRFLKCPLHLLFAY